MSLDFDLTKISNYKTVCLTSDRLIKSVTQAIAFETMVVGINKITEENAREFLWRHRTMMLASESRALFSWTDVNGESHERNLEYDDVVRHVGLSTNASPLTRLQFLKNVCKIRDRMEQDAKRTQTRKLVGGCAS